MNTRRTISAFVFLAVVALITVIAVLAQDASRPAALPPPAVAKICGNFVIPAERKIGAFQRIQAEGCEDVRFIHVGEGQWLAYGTRVLIGEVGDGK
jgi:H+/gluconate symporter-like permease